MPAIRYQYDGLDKVAEYDASGALKKRYVFGPGTDEVAAWYNGAGTLFPRWSHADERGSVIATSDDTGAKTAIDSYDEYGVPAAGNTGRFGYTGQAWLPSLGMWYYKARMYNPGKIPGFMQPDPIGYGSGMNMYGYVGGDPVNFTDPSGMVRMECHLSAGGILETQDGIFDGRVEVCAWVLGASDFSFGSGPLRDGYRHVGGSGRSVAPTKGTPQNDDIVVTAKKYAKKLGQCVADQYGLGALGAGLTAAGQPIAGTKAFVTAGSSKGTSLAGMAADAIFGSARSSFRLPGIVGSFPKFLTGRALGIVGTKSIARFAGRAVPIVGEALLAYDAVSIAICTAE